MSSSVLYANFPKENTPKKYVAWIDVMGSAGLLVRSLPKAVNHVLRLQSAVIRASKTVNGSLTLYPMNDGVFVVSETLDDLKKCIKESYRQVALYLATCDSADKLFMARAAIAYGPLFEGHKVTDVVCPDVSRSEMGNRLLLGAPVANAYAAEKATGPYGVFVHESARLYGNESHSGALYRYWSVKDQNKEATIIWVNELKSFVYRYLDYCEKRSSELDYRMDKIQEHRQLAKEFFVDLPDLPSEIAL